MQPGKNRSRICYYDWEGGKFAHKYPDGSFQLEDEPKLYIENGVVKPNIKTSILNWLFFWASRMISSNLFSFARMSGLYLRGFIFKLKIR